MADAAEACPGRSKQMPVCLQAIAMTDTYELAEIAARGCPPSIIDEPTPEQTPWRRRSIRLHEDAPRRTRPDVLISHAHESPAGLYRPRPSSYDSAAAQLFRLVLPVLGEREAGIKPAQAISGTSPARVQ